jgi:hypothetical protein
LNYARHSNSGIKREPEAHDAVIQSAQVANAGIMESHLPPTYEPMELGDGTLDVTRERIDFTQEHFYQNKSTFKQLANLLKAQATKMKRKFLLELSI